MSDINTVTLTGRLGKDIELTYTGGGKAVAEVSLAVNRGYGDQEKADWFGLVFWEKQAESVAKTLRKGRKIAIQGRLSQEVWNDKATGKQQSKTKVVVIAWTFADSNPQDGQTRETASRPDQQPRRSQAEESLPVNYGPDTEDGIPF